MILNFHENTIFTANNTCHASHKNSAPRRVFDFIAVNFFQKCFQQPLNQVKFHETTI